ncbi:carboxymuconolactone decarboxylase family protein [Agaribacterium sp. ZY112]|uniref:carboxymuconolactone decarboxylase family protein n=1 Tax=Agaribacterium sp. ZY112 TaxID=3233574 RepID=UPI003524EF61
MTARITFNEVPSSIYQSMSAIGETVHGSGLDKGLLELVCVYVSTDSKCAYCIDMHIKEALHAGIELNKLYSVCVFDSVDYYSDLEHACLAWAKFLLESGNEQQGQELYQQLLNFISQENIAILSLAITNIHSWTKLMKAFGIPAGDYQIGQFS